MISKKIKILTLPNNYKNLGVASPALFLLKLDFSTETY